MAIDVTAAQLTQTTFQSGSGTDDLWMRASDGTDWGAWKAFHVAEYPMQDLLFCFLRHKGIHIWDGFPCFLTEAHTDADVDRIIVAFRESVDEMQEAGFFPEAPRRAEVPAAFDAGKPPVLGARLGRDPSGNPAWFVPNPAEPGKYMKVEIS